MSSRKGFTILELAVVIAIIAILAAMAVPNFLECQTRGQSSRMRMEMRRTGLTPVAEKESNTEAYDHIVENPFLTVAANPLSTFSIDVDTASYANMRRFIEQGSLPPADAIRIEELVNYFTYEYPEPEGQAPFSVLADVGASPWDQTHRLARVALKARAIEWADRPVCNLVFLLDTSGSMQDPVKLPLVKQSLKMLVENLSEKDRVAIVTYAGSSGLALRSVSCADPRPVLASLDRLEAGGSTNGAEGIELAYATATEHFISGGLNRVILATDGDFNVGITDQGSLVRLIEEKARGGITLSVLGYGMGNIKDSTLEKLADHGNGNYAYIDSINEARKALVEQISGTLLTLARDVKIQVEFNPTRVAAYRLIGYENRMLRAEDFKDDTKDAGDMGAGHCVTALYEIVPPGAVSPAHGLDPLKYTETRPAASAGANPEMMTVKIRYKEPESKTSRQLETTVADDGHGPKIAAEDFQFAAAVAQWGMLLRDSKFKGNATPEQVEQWAGAALGRDPHGYRKEFLELVRKGHRMMENRKPPTAG